MASTMMVGPLAELDDAALCSVARDGDRAAFDELYERYADELFGFLVKLLRDEALAEDVLQETFFRLYTSLDRPEAPRSVRGFLYQIARNAAIDVVRVRRKEGRLAVAASAPPPAESPPHARARREEVERARAALERLDDEQRALLIERHGAGRKLEELAASWSCTERTIRNRLREAAQALAAAIGATTEEGRS